MKAVVTGASGFIGKNLVVALRRLRVEVAEIDADSSAESLRMAVSGAAVLFHLAGVNRPEEESDFIKGNVGSLETLFDALREAGSGQSRPLPPLIVLSSSTQAICDNPYGRSKRAAELALESYAGRTGTPAVIYRLPGVFGKWCRPNYNSVVATFCYNIARHLPIVISESSRVIDLVHIDDVVAQFTKHLDGEAVGVTRGEVRPCFTVNLGELAHRIRSFGEMRETLHVPDASDPFISRLFSTYTSYLPPGDLAYALQQRTDARGTLAELLKSVHFGQMFVSRTNPGFTRGNHYHDAKVEKFCVVDGHAVVRFRSILGEEVTEYRVSGTDFKVIDIPPGMTHSIENIGTTQMIVLFWASEILDPQRPDVHHLEVRRD